METLTQILKCCFNTCILQYLLKTLKNITIQICLGGGGRRKLLKYDNGSSFFSDDIRNLLPVLASIHPDSTLSVRAAYDSSKKQPAKLIPAVSEQLILINKNRGLADLKNCFYYFAGDASKINNGQSLGNFQDIKDICSMMTLSIKLFRVDVQQFISDNHVSVFLSLYKSSKILRLMNLH